MDIREKTMVKVGDSCTLSGRYGGKPAPTVAWSKNDEELKADEEIGLHSTARHLSLTVNKAKREHSGRYGVTVENAAGSRTGVCTITVVGKYPCPHLAPRSTRFSVQWLALPPSISRGRCHSTRKNNQRAEKTSADSISALMIRIMLIIKVIISNNHYFYHFL